MTEKPSERFLKSLEQEPKPVPVQRRKTLSFFPSASDQDSLAVKKPRRARASLVPSRSILKSTTEDNYTVTGVIQVSVRDENKPGLKKTDKRRVSFAPEATLHTFPTDGLQQNQLGPLFKINSVSSSSSDSEREKEAETEREQLASIFSLNSENADNEKPQVVEPVQNPPKESTETPQDESGMAMEETDTAEIFEAARQQVAAQEGDKPSSPPKAKAKAKDPLIVPSEPSTESATESTSPEKPSNVLKDDLPKATKAYSYASPMKKFSQQLDQVIARRQQSSPGERPKKPPVSLIPQLPEPKISPAEEEEDDMDMTQMFGTIKEKVLQTSTSSTPMKLGDSSSSQFFMAEKRQTPEVEITTAKFTSVVKEVSIKDGKSAIDMLFANVTKMNHNQATRRKSLAEMFGPFSSKRASIIEKVDKDSETSKKNDLENKEDDMDITGIARKSTDEDMDLTGVASKSTDEDMDLTGVAKKSTDDDMDLTGVPRKTTKENMYLAGISKTPESSTNITGLSKPSNDEDMDLTGVSKPRDEDMDLTEIPKKNSDKEASLKKSKSVNTNKPENNMDSANDFQKSDLLSNSINVPNKDDDEMDFTNVPSKPKDKDKDEEMELTEIRKSNEKVTEDEDMSMEYTNIPGTLPKPSDDDEMELTNVPHKSDGPKKSDESEDEMDFTNVPKRNKEVVNLLSKDNESMDLTSVPKKKLPSVAATASMTTDDGSMDMDFTEVPIKPTGLFGRRLSVKDSTRETKVSTTPEKQTTNAVQEQGTPRTPRHATSHANKVGGHPRDITPSKGRSASPISRKRRRRQSFDNGDQRGPKRRQTLPASSGVGLASLNGPVTRTPPRKQPQHASTVETTPSSGDKSGKSSSNRDVFGVAPVLTPSKAKILAEKIAQISPRKSGGSFGPPPLLSGARGPIGKNVPELEAVYRFEETQLGFSKLLKFREGEKEQEVGKEPEKQESSSGESLWTGLKEFLRQINIEFMDKLLVQSLDKPYSTAAKAQRLLRLHEQMMKKSGDEGGDPGLAEYAVEKQRIPQWEMFKFGFREMRKDIKSIQNIIAEVEQDMAAVPGGPRVVEYYTRGTAVDQAAIEAKLMMAKNYMRTRSKGRWYKWRLDLMGGLVDSLEKNKQALVNDRKLLESRVENVGGTQKLAQTHNEVSELHKKTAERLQQLKARQATLLEKQKQEHSAEELARVRLRHERARKQVLMIEERVRKVLGELAAQDERAETLRAERDSLATRVSKTSLEVRQARQDRVHELRSVIGKHQGLSVVSGVRYVDGDVFVVGESGSCLRVELEGGLLVTIDGDGVSRVLRIDPQDVSEWNGSGGKNNSSSSSSRKTVVAKFLANRLFLVEEGILIDDHSGGKPYGDLPAEKDENTAKSLEEKLGQVCLRWARARAILGLLARAGLYAVLQERVFVANDGGDARVEVTATVFEDNDENAQAAVCKRRRLAVVTIRSEDVWDPSGKCLRGLLGLVSMVQARLGAASDVGSGA
ncbi:uncharacterized protein SAPINGB_P003028 [Magnusiomyces paraingens]|uniref:Spc7 kinetochore protein domain-containing protein n=1 Tax=Magnusiomyces paraingens TaxID=2606893 RepID=A0A5E8BK14_9ASCO|nr:uncharacterized protein SAPINGB_P003028 [Saprochaete ingens]VVT51232.1 unnamed protein product [Saprochaete ingens]